MGLCPCPHPPPGLGVTLPGLWRWHPCPAVAVPAGARWPHTALCRLVPAGGSDTARAAGLSAALPERPARSCESSRHLRASEPRPLSLRSCLEAGSGQAPSSRALSPGSAQAGSLPGTLAPPHPAPSLSGWRLSDGELRRPRGRRVGVGLGQQEGKWVLEPRAQVQRGLERPQGRGSGWVSIEPGDLLGHCDFTFRKMKLKRAEVT